MIHKTQSVTTHWPKQLESNGDFRITIIIFCIVKTNISDNHVRAQRPSIVLVRTKSEGSSVSGSPGMLRLLALVVMYLPVIKRRR